jgi:hypothetical protein
MRAQVSEGEAASTAASEKTFIMLELVDSEGTRRPFERYQITAADGMVFSGKLDANGSIRVDDLAQGDCSVTFPDLHDDWSVAG